MNEHESNPDWEDRLVDVALSEAIGGQSPPDLSEQILAASSGEPTASPLPGDQAMNDVQHVQITRRRNWTMLAVAASLLVAAGAITFLPFLKSGRDAPTSVTIAKRDEAAKDNIAARKESAAEPGQQDTDLVSLADGIKDSSGSVGKPVEENLDLVISQSQSVLETEPADEMNLMVTPQIIISDGAEGEGLEIDAPAPALAETNGDSLPSPYYATDDVQYHAPRPEFEIAREAGESESRDASGNGQQAAGKQSAEGTSFASRSARQRALSLSDGSNRSSPARGGRYAQSLDSLGDGGVAGARPRAERFYGRGDVSKGVPANQQAPATPETLAIAGSSVNGAVTDLDGEMRYRAPTQQAADDSGLSEELSERPMNDAYAVLDSKARELDAREKGKAEVPEIRHDWSPTARGEVTRQLNEKIYEYQIAASRDWGRDRSRYHKRLSELNSEIDYLRREKRRFDAQHGIGAGRSGDKYSRIYENSFIEPKGEKALSTFSIDVDTASYANTRQFLMQSHQLPPPDAVRLEELINYFDYDYSGPEGDVPFASHVEVAGCPWNAEHRLVRIGIKGREIDRRERPQSNLVFLIDVSGSMDEPAKLPLLVEGMKLLTRELGENDKVAIVVYASSEGLALPSTRGDKQQEILGALNKLRAGGSTAGGAGIELAYKTAIENFIEGGVNRVILCTDGDFNVGITSTDALERMAEENAKETGVFLTVLGFGRGNLNDAMMEKISGKGNGNYHYVDNLTEARKVLVEEMAGTLVTIAKDVKIQVEFNPGQVAAYRLLGYENRVMRAEDFNDDTKDAGEIGAGHTVTALYEIVPAGQSVDVPPVDELTFQKTEQPDVNEELKDKLLKLKIRYKQPDGDKSTKQEFLIADQGGSFANATPDFQFASAVASFGMLLRNSEYKGNTSYSAVAEIAGAASKRDPHGYRTEFLEMVQRAKQLSGE